MVDQIKSKEDAQRILTEKITEFAKELTKVKENFGHEAADLLKGLQNGSLSPADREKIMAHLRESINNGYMNQLWRYAGFAICFLIVLTLFVFVAYYKLYKPMADRERKQLEKREKKAKKQSSDRKKKRN